MEIPIGLDASFNGVVDLVNMKAVYFDGDNGEIIREEEIPAELLDEAQQHREKLLDKASMFSDDLMELLLEEEEVPAELLLNALRVGVLQRKVTPVFMGSAYKNKGVQLLLDGVMNLLPNPAEIENFAIDAKTEKKIPVANDDTKPTIALAFKLEDGQYGQLTYIRVYDGTLTKGDTVLNVRTGQKVKIGRVIRMHASQMEDIEAVPAGYIGALFGVECASGDTFADPSINMSMTSIFVPEPVISLAIKPASQKAEANMSKALNRFSKEDPTFRAKVNEETNETIISGMGELHLEVYVERMKREYNAEVIVGAPQVAYRETITQHADFDYTHKKQTGGSGQYGRVAGYIEPLEGEDFAFESQVVGGTIPTQYIPACEKGFRSCLAKGPKLGFPVTNVKVVINDGASHSVDSSDMAFQAAARGAFQEGYRKASPVIMEPIMKVVVETPTEFQGAAMGSLNQRRGLIVGSQDEGTMCNIEAHVPLAEMFGYSTVLRSLTQGQAQFTMEFAEYKQVPNSISEELVKKAAEEKK